MRYLTYFLMLSKRLFKKPSFILILLLMPVFSFAVMHFSITEESNLNIAIYSEGNDELNKSMAEYLVGIDGLVSFYQCSSANEVYSRVKNRTSDCGYIIPDELSERLEKNVLLGAIESVTSPGSTMSALANEFVITSLLNNYAFDILKDLTIESGDFKNMSDDEIERELYSYYETYLFSDKTFTFEYENVSDEFSDEIDIIPDFLINSVYGINALFIFISALAGTLMLYNDSKNGIFNIFKPLQKALLQYFVILIPTLVCVVITIFNSFILEGFNNVLIQLFKSLGYALLCSGCCFLLKQAIHSVVIFSSALPVFIIGGMIFCPVFIDISIVVPKLTTIKYLFLPTYYLISNNFSTTLILMICGIFISAISVLISHRHYSSVKRWNGGYNGL